MNPKEQIITELKDLTNHQHVEILIKGNAAIWSALHLAKEEVLIPEEGGWLTYQQYPKKLGLKLVEVNCQEAVIDLADLKEKSKTADVLLYQNPGGYHAQQKVKEIYEICQKNNCLVILDISGGIGTELCAGEYADVMLGSFGRWKPIDAQVGGFISTNNKELFDQIKDSFKLLVGEDNFKIILEKIKELPNRIKFLLNKRNKVIADLEKLGIKNIINKSHFGLVLIVGYTTEQEKETIINHCNNSKLEYTECPRYIRINKKAISIEIKRLAGE